MPTFITTLKTVARLLWNKGAAILVLGFLMYRYATLNSAQPTPFAELLYAIILAASILVFAPVFRLLVFPEAAEYAENGSLRRDLDAGIHSPALTHYRFATAISFAATALSIVSLL